MKSFELQFESAWILRHRSDDVMPVSKVGAYLAKRYKELQIVKETYSYLEISAGDKFDITDFIVNVRKFLFSEYDDFEASYFVIYEGIEKAIAQCDVDLDGVDEVFRKKSDETSRVLDKATLSPVEKTLQEIDSLISGVEFKSLAHEIADLASILKANNTQKVFFNQRYLFSINDGCCLDEYLTLLSKLLVASELMDKCEVINRKLQPTKPNSDDPRSTLLRDIKHESSLSILCVDISDWMNQVNTLEFKEFLTDLKRAMGKAILVFRIPFVDKEVLENIARALNDMLFIRKLSFPPFSNEEIGKFADREISKYGFSMDEKAWSGFFARIREENSDGRFYGTETIEKVVEELLYTKHVSNLQNNVSDKMITELDADKLCQVSFVDNLSGLEMLDNMVGTENIKNRVLEIISQIDLVRKTPSMGSPSLHMRFVGNPGTGKTTIARIIGKILKEKGILRVGEFHEHSGRDFCGRYIGETAPKTMNLCRAAYGSVLFIDEAYSLYREDNDRDYGKEALDTLIAEMENHRSDFVVIMAGYTDEMDRLMKGNAGLLSRMPYTLEFPNFTKPQLYQIFVSMCKDKIKCDQGLFDVARDYFEHLDDEFIMSKDFSNARFVRNLFERVCSKAALRCQLDGKEIMLTKDDFERSIIDKEFLVKKKRARIGF